MAPANVGTCNRLPSFLKFLPSFKGSKSPWLSSQTGRQPSPPISVCMCCISTNHEAERTPGAPQLKRFEETFTGLLAGTSLGSSLELFRTSPGSGTFPHHSATDQSQRAWRDAGNWNFSLYWNFSAPTGFGTRYEPIRTRMA